MNAFKEFKMKYSSFIENTQSDYYRYYGKRSKNIWISGLFGNMNFRLVFFFRLAQLTMKKRTLTRVIVTIARRRMNRTYLNSLARDTEIGPGFCAYHYNNIRISSAARIGKNFTVGHLVTIGWVNRGHRKGVPTIGDNVFIGPGAIIVGNIKIGNDVMIAGNSFVNIDVPSNSIVYGNPCIIKAQENPTEGYILNKI